MLMNRALGFMLLSQNILHLFGIVAARSKVFTCHQQCLQQSHNVESLMQDHLGSNHYNGASLVIT